VWSLPCHEDGLVPCEGPIMLQDKCVEWRESVKVIKDLLANSSRLVPLFIKLCHILFHVSN
jgi:hypothetical protein